ncbi:MAG: glyoxalase [Thalassobius sp.]|nr:glyoxalase [Thalassovita sp.]
MSTRQEVFSHAACILPVSHIDEAIVFYTEKLGFHLNFTWNEPIDYAILKKGEVNIHLSRRKDAPKPDSMYSSIYIFVHDAEMVYNNFKSKGVTIVSPLCETDYGMKEFDIKDTEGYVLSFGESL